MQKKHKTSKTKETERQVDYETGANPEVIERGEKLKEDIDKLMDEIDDVLQKNAEEFVKAYVQKGGQ